MSGSWFQGGYNMKLLPKEVFIFSQLFGGFPMEITLGSKDKKGKLRFSILVFLWSLVLIVLQTVMAVLGLYTDYGENRAGHTVRMFMLINTILVVLVDIVSLSLLLPVVLHSCSRKHRLFLKVLDILDKVEQNLQQDLPVRKAKVKMFLVCTVIMTLIVCNGVLDFTSSLSTSRPNHMTSLCYIPAQFMYFAQAALFLHFTHITESIALRFRTINAEIKEALLRNRSERIVLRESPRINVCESVAGVSSICKVKSLMDTYWMLCEAVQKPTSSTETNCW
ncbi:hypothetical protein J6590_062010 [Homalodisca vitripennis]|nr:hypothetical protein J6590_062010 [Homalodisca vitripennis]